MLPFAPKRKLFECKHVDVHVTLEIFFTREAVWILCITSKLFSGNWGWDAAEAYRDQCGKAWHHWKKTTQ